MSGARPLRHPDPMQPSPTLWNHSRRCGALFRRDIATPPPVQPELSPHQDPRTSVQTTTRRGPPSKLPPGKHMSHHDACGSRDLPGQPSHRKHCTSVQQYYAKYLAARLEAASPWPMKGGGSRLAASIFFAPTPTRSYLHSHPPILAPCLNHLAGTWRLLLISHLACSPPLQAPPV
jgi:hypothetical protein